MLNRTLTYRLHRIHKLSDQASQRAYLREIGLSLSEGRCLATVGAFQPLSVNELAKAANLTKSQASRAAQTLVDKGLVQKIENKDDGRGVVLSLDPEAVPIWEQSMALIYRRNQEIFGCLTESEQASLSSFFDRIEAHIS